MKALAKLKASKLTKSDYVEFLMDYLGNDGPALEYAGRLIRTHRGPSIDELCQLLYSTQTSAEMLVRLRDEALNENMALTVLALRESPAGTNKFFMDFLLCPKQHKSDWLTREHNRMVRELNETSQKVLDDVLTGIEKSLGLKPKDPSKDQK